MEHQREARIGCFQTILHKLKNYSFTKLKQAWSVVIFYQKLSWAIKLGGVLVQRSSLTGNGETLTDRATFFD